GSAAVQIDLKPGSDNTINLGSNGSLSLAILGSADFNASLVDQGSLAIATDAGAVDLAIVSSALQDVNGDGRLDLAVSFRPEAVKALLLATYGGRLEAADSNADGVLDAGVSNHQSAEITLRGQTTTGDRFVGADLAELFLAGRSLKDFLATLGGWPVGLQVAA